MDVNLIIGYASLLLAFLALVAAVIKPGARSRVLLIIISILVLVSVTLVLWRPLKVAVREALLFPDGVEQIEEEAEKRSTWGPQDREMFTWSSPATYATFNSMTDNPTLGHESNFVRVREAGTDTVFSDDVEIIPGKEYEVFMYFHNNGASNLNPDVMAYNTRIQASFPEELKAGQSGVIKGCIYWTNDAATETYNVWDTAFLHASSDVKLSYIMNSAVLHNGSSESIYSTDGAILDSESLFSAGARVAYDSRYWGIIPGCNDYAGYVLYRIRAE